uniref:Kinesin-like protein KIN-14G n=1 Tax=Oryza sativa subsp. japonica TaxID=39947 RepID=KN14G_ORYSJ|nr:RecName: Full=Kinesin-like protein KIN-14G [Oryza sativa Japonica Group]
MPIVGNAGAGSVGAKPGSWLPEWKRIVVLLGSWTLGVRENEKGSGSRLIKWNGSGSREQKICKTTLPLFQACIKHLNSRDLLSTKVLTLALYKYILRAPQTAPHPPAAPPRTEVASSTAGRASRTKSASSTGRVSRANPASFHRPRLLRQAGLHLRRPRLSRQAGLRCHRLHLSAPSRSPTPPPNAVAPSSCSRLPRARLAIRGRRASSHSATVDTACSRRHSCDCLNRHRHLAVVATSAVAATTVAVPTACLCCGQIPLGRHRHNQAVTGRDLTVAALVLLAEVARETTGYSNGAPDPAAVVAISCCRPGSIPPSTAAAGSCRRHPAAVTARWPLAGGARSGRRDNPRRQGTGATRTGISKTYVSSVVAKTLALQELKGNIRVFCRVRPLLPNESGAVAYPKSGENLGRGIELTHNGQMYFFTFDKVFEQSTSQEDVFIEISHLVQSALDGYKVCIFAYGQTGSGKTYTMMGNPELHDQKGLIPRSLEQIFQTSQALISQGWKYKMQASMLEIYNEAICDLLATNHTTIQDGGASKYSIKHDANGNTHVSDLIIVDVLSINEVSSLLKRAAQSRSVGRTQMNEESSRSHCVFTLRFFGVNEGTDQQVQGVLNLIDLAGSERLNKSGATGDRLKETQAINKSLSCLSDVIFSIAKKEEHVPFRNSKLTYLLQPCLGGDSKTLMFVNLSPEVSSTGESICSLRFAARVNSCEIGIPRRQTQVRSLAQG